MIDPTRPLPGPRPASAAQTRPIGGLDPTRPLRITTLGDRLLTAPTFRNSVAFHLLPEDSLAALRSAIADARGACCVEIAVWRDDPTFQAILAALAKRKDELAAQGRPFAVRLLVDGAAPPPDARQALGERGIEIQALGERGPLPPRELYLVDGTHFLAGGSDRLFTVRGEEAGRVRQAFLENWRRAGGGRPTDLPPVEPDSSGRVRLQSVTTNPLTRRFALRELQTRAIEEASREIVLTGPALTDERLTHALLDAKRRSPELSIKVLSTAGDPAAARRAQQDANALLLAGVEIRVFGGDLPVKALVVDRELLSIGSAEGGADAGALEFNVAMGDKDTVESFYDEVLAPVWLASTPLRAKAPTWRDRLARRALEVLDALF